MHTLITTISNTLLNQSKTLCVAESCTGGGLSYYLTSLAGSSAWFERGFVTYSNAAKIELLGVREETLNKYGAVSAETAAEMAAGALSHSRADISISITGIAGPTGGTKDKPVGTVWIGFASRQGLTETHLCHFTGTREAIRTATISHTLSALVEFLQGSCL